MAVTYQERRGLGDELSGLLGDAGKTLSGLLPNSDEEAAAPDNSSGTDSLSKLWDTAKSTFNGAKDAIGGGVTTVENAVSKPAASTGGGTVTQSTTGGQVTKPTGGGTATQVSTITKTGPGGVPVWVYVAGGVVLVGGVIAVVVSRKKKGRR